MKRWGKQRIERNFIHKEKIIFSKFDENKQFEKGDVFKPIMGTPQRFREYNSKQDFEVKLYYFVEGDNGMSMTALWKRIFPVA